MIYLQRSILQDSNLSQVYHTIEYSNKPTLCMGTITYNDFYKFLVTYCQVINDTEKTSNKVRPNRHKATYTETNIVPDFSDLRNYFEACKAIYEYAAFLAS